MAGGELMIGAVKNYLAARRAAGFELKSAYYLLHSFARFAAARGETHVRPTTAIDWASRAASVAQRDARLKAVCRFARYMGVEDSRHELPPSRHFGYHKTRPLPHIYSHEEIHRLMDAALKLGPPHSAAAQTFVTLIGLLAATGLRISEALNLQLSDITPNGLLIRKRRASTVLTQQEELTRRPERIVQAVSRNSRGAVRQCG
jgi:integrase/recombinase XerD